MTSAERYLLSRAYVEWCANRAYWKGGNYWRKRVTGARPRRARIAPWNRLAKRAHDGVDAFHRAAHAFVSTRHIDSARGRV